jgi:hypothetical protein
VNRTPILLAAVSMLLATSTAWALTSLSIVTPKNIKGSTFTLTSKPVRNNSVQFVIRRNVRGIDGPGTTAYVTDPSMDPKRLGTPVKLEQDGKTFTFRFSVPAEKVKNSVFTLWGNGLAAEGITFKFHLGEFWKPETSR